MDKGAGLKILFRRDTRVRIPPPALWWNELSCQKDRKKNRDEVREL
jgi:hypothetical protein